MIHERQDQLICGPVMPQGGLQAAEVMLFTIDKVNQLKIMPNEVTLGTQICEDKWGISRSCRIKMAKNTISMEDIEGIEVDILEVSDIENEHDEYYVQ